MLAVGPAPDLFVERGPPEYIRGGKGHRSDPLSNYREYSTFWSIAGAGSGQGCQLISYLLLDFRSCAWVALGVS